ncbi:MAG TPA: efflux RND transporter periplasmic adaptor subunit [Bryobacteraceae bacterium]|nr:efflux RND transporter periplasmic adaptor subunit [Bryobacteraceae bacterium]
MHQAKPADDLLEVYGFNEPEAAPEPPRRSRRKWWISGGAVCVLALLAAALIPKLTGGGAPVTTFATVDRGDIVKTISATGRVQALKTVEVGSQISGVIAGIFADFNTQVKQGQVIARLDSEQLEAQLAQARANLLAAQAGVMAAQGSVASSEASITAAEANADRARSAMEDARASYARNLELFNAGVLARQALDTSKAGFDQSAAQYNQAVAQAGQSKAQLTTVRAQLASARAQEQQARAAVEIASVNLGRSVITAPVDGVVIARNVDVGQTVAASLQAPTLFVIANDLSAMQVLADVDEADVGQLAPGAKASFTVDAFPRDTFEGRIAQVRLNPTTVQNVVTYTAVIDVANPGLKLRPGMTANITAVVAETKNVLRIPNAALRYQPGSRAVYKQAGEELKPVNIRQGLTDGRFTEVVSGDLREGDRIALPQVKERAAAPRPSNPLAGGGRRGR